MGTFLIASHNPWSQVSMIHMILDLVSHPHDSYDPWLEPHPSTIDSLGDYMPLSHVEAAYDTI